MQKLHPDVMPINFPFCRPLNGGMNSQKHATFLLPKPFGAYTWKESSLQYKCNKSYGTCNKLPFRLVIPPVFQKKSPFRMFGKDYPFSVCDCIHNCAFRTRKHEQCRDEISV